MPEGRTSLDVGQGDSLFLTYESDSSLTVSPSNEHVKQLVDADVSNTPSLLDAIEALAVQDSTPSTQTRPLSIGKAAAVINTTLESSTTKDPENMSSHASVIASGMADRPDMMDNICDDKEEIKDETDNKEAEEQDEEDKETSQDLLSLLSVDGPKPLENWDEYDQETETPDIQELNLEQTDEHTFQQLIPPALGTTANLLTPAHSSTQRHFYPDEDEDEDERGTVVILSHSQHRGFRRGSVESISTVSSISSAPCEPTDAQDIEDQFIPHSELGPFHAASTSSVDSRTGSTPTEDHAESTLQSSKSGLLDNIIAAVSELHSQTSSCSVSSSGNSTPAAQIQRLRPFSQQPLPVSFPQTPLVSAHYDHAAVDEDEFQFRPIRRSRSMPSSPKSFSSFEVVSLSAFDSPQPMANRFSEYISAPKLEQELSCDWLPSQHSPTCPLHFGPHKEGEIATREILRDEPDSLPLEAVPAPLQFSPILSERPRRQSLLTPRQLQRLSQQKDGFQLHTKETTGPLWKTRLGYLGKDNHKNTSKKRKGSVMQEQGSNTRNPDSTHSSAEKPSRSVKPLMPSIAFQLHQTEISTERPSVSGRLILHIPRRAGKKFHFVSLALHLRLKESIAWVRHDLFSFEVENHHWAQTVWDKKMMIPFQDRQVEEGDANAFGSRMARGISPAAAIAAAALAAHSETKLVPKSTPIIHQDTLETTNISHSQPTTPHLESSAFENVQSDQYSGLTDTERLSKTDSHIEAYVPLDMKMDEWRWEWLLPVSRSEARPESFEGSMGMVWYELEAKCLFRWDDVDEDGNVIPNHSSVMTTVASTTLAGSSDSSNAHSGMEKSCSGSRKLLKGFGASTKRAKSIAQAFGKLRVGNKTKNTAGVGDFNVPSLHEQYIQNSIRKTQEAAEAAAAAAATATAEAARVGGEDLGQKTNGQGNDAHGGIHHDNQSDNVCTAGNASGISTKGADENPSCATVPPRTLYTSIPRPLTPEPVPFLVRKTLKLYLSRPTPKTSSNPAFFLPQPLMSLPTLPSTRRLKAIIPGAKIQVQIQVPSIIPIPGYAQSSQLVPNAKTGGLVHMKGSGNTCTATASKNTFRDKFSSDHSRRNSKDHCLQQDNRYPRNFQAALTIRKVTQQDINKNESLRRRYEFAESATSPTRRFPIGPNSSTASHHATDGSVTQASGRSRSFSHQSVTNGSSMEEHSPNDLEEVVTAYPCADDPTGDKTKQQGSAGTQDPPHLLQNKGWRKEIRVRKVKCEFWQKESCRIPTDDAPSRSIKVQLAPVFSYSERDHEKERQRHAASQHHSSVSLDPMVSHLPDDLQSKGTESNVHEGRRGSVYTLCPPLTEPSRPWTSRKGSTGSIFSSGFQSHLPFSSSSHLASTIHTQPNRPFMLLVPIPLDNPRLRQTFSWPSAETPSPTTPSAYDYSFPRTPGAESGVGFGSEFDYPSQLTMYEMMGATSRGGGGHAASTNPTGPPVKARIEVKHYLSFRLSLDLLEYEGEVEQDDIDLEAIEEQQLQEARGQQDLSLAPERPINSGVPQLSPPEPLSAVTIALQQPGSIRVPSTPASPTSACGSLCADPDADYDTVPGPELFGMVYERRGSKESLGTMRSATSGNSASIPGAEGALSSITQTQVSSGLSGGSNVSDRLSTPQPSASNNTRSGGLVAGAIGALKKKASGARLANIVGSSSTSSQGQQQQHVSNVTTQRLKDFVIRVPITIVIQIDDRGKVTSAFGAVDNPDLNSTTPIGSRMEDLSGQQTDRGTSFSSTVPLHGPGNITTTATTTIKNIVTGSSGEQRRSVDPLESTDTFGSLASVAASAGSESLRRRMDDFVTGSSSLAFAGLRRRQDQSSPAGTAHHHHPSLQKQQQTLPHYVSASQPSVPSLMPLTSEGLQQHLRATYQQDK
ncbi:hypothetical protein EC991_006423 [Linnemannia zychae]|nr:hypothetical protein EC991_006423 [Linnemannia zychae]